MRYSKYNLLVSRKVYLFWILCSCTLVCSQDMVTKHLAINENLLNRWLPVGSLRSWYGLPHRNPIAMGKSKQGGTRCSRVFVLVQWYRYSWRKLPIGLILWRGLLSQHARPCTTGAIWRHPELAGCRRVLATQIYSAAIKVLQSEHLKLIERAWWFL